MRKNLLVLVALGNALFFLTGCHSTLEGRLEPGLPFGKDTIVSRYERPYQQVYTAAKEVLKRLGTLTNDDIVTKTLRGRVDEATVWIQLDDSEPRLTKLSVQARTRGGAPNVDTASELDKQIYGYLITH